MSQGNFEISEQIALGMPEKTTGNGETLFDQRLFNTTKGMDSGYGDDEVYNVYDKSWRDSNSLASHLYRPSKQLDNDAYGGDLDEIVNTPSAAQRSGPVQFEKEEDPFGLDQFINMAKKAPKRTEDKNDRSGNSERKRRQD